MKTAIQATTDLYKYLKQRLAVDGYDKTVEVFKDEDKPVSYKGAYLAVNALPFVYGKCPNTDNILNLNVHVPDLANGDSDRIRLTELSDYLLASVIPPEDGVDDTQELFINGAYYCVRSISRPMSDVDSTHFVNIRIKIIF